MGTALAEHPATGPVAAAFHCREKGCKQTFPTQIGASTHRRLVHGRVSPLNEAVKKRLYRMRLSDPENAPAKRRTGPIPKNLDRVCATCRDAIKAKDPEAFEAGGRSLPLNTGDVEFIRKRLVWTSHKLAVELGAAEDKVVVVMEMLSARKFRPYVNNGRMG
jgi:hypothetical protein